MERTGRGLDADRAAQGLNMKTIRRRDDSVRDQGLAKSPCLRSGYIGKLTAVTRCLRSHRCVHLTSHGSVVMGRQCSMVMV